MALVDLIRKSAAKVAIANLAIPATELNKSGGSVASVATIAVAGECTGRTRNVTPMSMREEAALLKWLSQIEETDQAVIDCVLRDCQHDIEKRAFFLDLVAEIDG